ncbi:MAG: hypothetical protein IJI50_08215 [Ruminococcus sp.]|nr:hypothetical protein [Ruminococcus sp.]
MTKAAVKDIEGAYDRYLAGIKAVRERGTNIEKPADEGGAKFMIRQDIDGNSFVDVDTSLYNSNDGETVAKTIARIISKRFNNLIHVNGQSIQINKTTNDEWRMSKSARFLQEHNETAYNDKMKVIVNADEILKVANNWVGEELKHTRKDDIVEFARGNIRYRVGDNGYIADVIVGTRKSGSAVLYDIKNIYETKITETNRVTKARKNSLRTPIDSVDNNVSQSADKVKRQSRSDADYLSAVERGDMETAQRMVDEAAERAFAKSKIRLPDKNKTAIASMMFEKIP